MKKLLFFMTICFISFAYAYALDVNALFNLKSNGDISYYKSENIDNYEYSKAEELKSKLSAEGYLVRSIIIADILPNEGNEYIALVDGVDGDKILIYSKDKLVFSYESGEIASNAAIDLESFFDKDNNIEIVKYYILKESSLDREIYMHMFRIDSGKINLMADISFYKEINSMKTQVKMQMDNVFVDIDKDGIYEMLVESREQISGRSDRVEYQIYKLSKSKGKYVCVMSSWLEEESIDLSEYFKKR